ncbi:hypothetical protein [Croceimicrobium sp.]|uniref:hypothetical protein n=1 Tax=Croceimicrobium sp. TaxID=2828340 RepID=UPI003BAD855A
MRLFLLLPALFYGAINGWAQTTDSLTPRIPKHHLHFTESQTDLSSKLKSAKQHISAQYQSDSFHLFQIEFNEIYLAYGSKGQYQISRLNIPRPLDSEDKTINYVLKVDSLGQDQAYFTINWEERTFSQYSRSSGSAEFSCTEIITENESAYSGLVIISLESKSIVFEGISRAHLVLSEKRNPGNLQKTLSNDRTIKLRFWPGEPYLDILNHGNANQAYWEHYQHLEYGMYQLVDDQYTLIKN